MLSTMEAAHVLIVGAGPTGLLLAAELRRHGLTVRVLESRTERSQQSRALAVHSRTIEVLEDMGIAREALTRGRLLHGVSIFANGRRIVHASFDELDAPHRYVLVIPQNETEEILERRALELGATIDRGRTVTTVLQDDEGVTATLEDGEHLRAQWLVGCDGVRSTVRNECAIEWEGEDIDARFALGDLQVRWDLEPDEFQAFFSPKGVLAFIPLPAEGRWRMVASLPSEGPAPEVTLELLRELYVQRSHLPATLDDPSWLSNFSVRQRRAVDYRRGRVFLAGDAAHAHSPVGGQGMNTGLQDAHNLGWKLALVHRGLASESLLDSYQRERAPVVEAVVRNTGIGTRMVALRHPVAQGIRNRLASFLTSLEVVQQRAARTVGELNVSYRSSPVVREHCASLTDLRIGDVGERESPSFLESRDFVSGPRAGERAPDAVLREGRRLHEALWGTAHVALYFDGPDGSAEGYERMNGLAAHLRQRLGDRIAVRFVVPSDRVPELLPDDDVWLDPEEWAHRRYGASAECLYDEYALTDTGEQALEAHVEWLREETDL